MGRRHGAAKGKNNMITCPTIHLNGSSYHHLVESLGASIASLRVAITNLQSTCPHGRDYYVVDGAFEKARSEYIARLQKLQSVLDELQEIRTEILVQVRK